MRTRNLLIAVVAAVVVLGAACTGTAAEPATTTSSTTTIPAEIPDLEFGSGVVPFTVPADFPIPETAVVGTTMIDGMNGRSEMNVNFPAQMVDVVEYYETNLSVLGYDVTDSKGSETEWDIVHTKDGVEGTIHLTQGGGSVTSGTLTFGHV